MLVSVQDWSSFLCSFKLLYLTIWGTFLIHFPRIRSMGSSDWCFHQILTSSRPYMHEAYQKRHLFAHTQPSQSWNGLFFTVGFSFLYSLSAGFSAFWKKSIMFFALWDVLGGHSGKDLRHASWSSGFQSGLELVLEGCQQKWIIEVLHPYFFAITTGHIK